MQWSEVMKSDSLIGGSAFSSCPSLKRGASMSSIESIKRDLKPWTSSYGEVRYYIKDWYPLVSDVLDRYTAE